MQKITPFLWFDKEAEEAAGFYVSVFKDSKIIDSAKYDENGAKQSGMKEGQVMTVSFEILGQKFMALNGGPIFKINEAVSFMIECEDQTEVDYYWEKLASGGGKEIECGWLKDRFGLCWQVVPKILGQYMTDPDKAKASRVMAAMLKMKKLDIAALKKAYEGR
jgi:predicted 3-demethylubiquinone-9 3-methyltransferase (glyoxalase superfamily)